MKTLYGFDVSVELFQCTCGQQIVVGGSEESVLTEKAQTSAEALAKLFAVVDCKDMTSDQRTEVERTKDAYQQGYLTPKGAVYQLTQAGVLKETA